MALSKKSFTPQLCIITLLISLVMISCKIPDSSSAQFKIKNSIHGGKTKIKWKRLLISFPPRVKNVCEQKTCKPLPTAVA
jgi:hypothetical protein